MKENSIMVITLIVPVVASTGFTVFNLLGETV